MIFFLFLSLITQPLQDITNSVTAYQRGSYRQVKTLLSSSHSLSFEDHYRLIQATLMIDGGDKTWEKAFSFSQDTSFHQFLSFFLMQKLVEKPLPTNTNVIFVLLRWLEEAKTNPFVTTNLIETIFWHAWRLNTNVSPPQEYFFLTTNYQAWQRFLGGDSSSLPVLLSHRTLLFVCWREFTNQLINVSNFSAISLSNLWTYLGRLPFSVQKTLATNYFLLFSSSQRWKAEVEYALATKEVSSVIRILEEALAERRISSLEDYQKAISWANQVKAYNLTEKLANQGIQRFGSIFHADYVRSLIRQNKHEELINWYQANEENIIHREVALSVFRLLIEKNDSRLMTWLTRRVERFPHQTFFLTLAFLHLERNEETKVYPLLLRILSDYPYTYEWWVAYEYAHPFHRRYPHIFTNWYTNVTNKLFSFPLQQRLLCTLALQDITKVLVSPIQFSNDLLHYQRSFLLTHFSLSQEQRALFNKLLTLSNTVWTNYPRELAMYLDRELRTPENRYKFAWYGYDLYQKADALGIALSRLDYAVRRYIGRESVVLLPEEWQKKLFPLEPFKDVLPFYGDTNHALWVLAAYRQESHFRKDVESIAGAYGYAQLMPTTARQLAKNLKQPDLHYRDYDDNVLMGNAFYTHLLRRYQWVPFALAAYNAGENAVNTWRRRYSFRSPLWIECIPYEETRNYVKVIWQKRAFYHRIYQQTFSSVPFALE